MRIRVAIMAFVGLIVFSFPKPVDAAVSNWQKGFSITPVSSTSFSGQSFQDSVITAKATGSNYVTLIVPWYQDSINTSSIYRGWNTPTDAALISAINYIHSQGMKVMLKMHLETADNQWRAYINPSDKNTWFASYSSMLTHYADIGKSNGVEEITIGAELATMSANAYTANWKTMIANVRQRYPGFLTYSANHGGPNEKWDIHFWDSLDYIGIAAYYALATNQANPTIDQLKQSWESWKTNDIQPISTTWNKPVLFTEIGYRSVDGAHYEPWSWWREGAANQTEQARLYNALMGYWNTQSYMQGVSLWEWVDSPNPSDPTGYTPQNKEAQNVVTTWFSQGSATTPTPTPTQTASQLNLTGSLTTNSMQVAASGSGSDLIVDLEIYNSSNQRVFQRFYEHQNLPQNFTTSWTPSTPGTYRLMGGIFNGSWGNLYWNSNIAVINTNATSPTPTQTLTPTPVVSTAPSPTPGTQVNSQVEIWWPGNGISVSGVQPFKGLLSNNPVSAYQLYWQVDQGVLNSMSVSNQDYPHYESQVDVSNWNWRGDGPYTVKFTAKSDTGTILGEKSIVININH